MKLTFGTKPLIFNSCKILYLYNIANNILLVLVSMDHVYNVLLMYFLFHFSSHYVIKI